MSDKTFDDFVADIEQTVQKTGYTETDVIELPRSFPETATEEEQTNTPEETQEMPPEQRIILVNADTGPDFVISAEEGEVFFEVQTSYPLWQEISQALSLERAEEIVPEAYKKEIPEDHPIHASVPPHVLEEDDEKWVSILAAFEILMEADTEVRKEIVYRLSEIFTNAEVKHVVDSPSETGAPHGFTVMYKIFPYDDQFGPRELNNVIERVRMAAHRATMFLRYTFNLGVDMNQVTEGNVEDGPQTPVPGLGPDGITNESID